jgi:hypothetical protein
VCTSSGQPAAQVTLDDGLTMNVSLGYFPDPRNPSFLRVPGVPFQEAGSKSFFMTNVFLPVTAGGGGIVPTGPVLSLATASDPNNPFFKLPLSQLPSCPTGTSVPSLSGGVLLLAALAIMALGVWGLGRRRAFYQALPLP